MKKALLLCAMICCALIIKAQQNLLSGSVIDQQTKKPIPHANVMLKGKDNLILTYKPTNDKGAFSFTPKESSGSLILEINYLGYQKFQKDISGQDKPLSIELIPKQTVLDEIEIKSKPKIKKTGDTLSYNVESFSKNEDRTIGDVLKRMPGVEVSESGQIKYQGKNISNFYIDGDDLLDDRYAIGTRTIPHHIVRDVQVMTNHEHVKVLKGKRHTDAVAINLVVKDDAKLSLITQAKLGAGLPSVYDAELNNHLFNKKIKFLNVLSANNIGRSYKGDLTGFDQKTLLSRFGSTSINNLLSFGTVGNAPVKSSQSYLNNSYSVNANNSFQLKNDWAAKISVTAIHNRDRNEYKGDQTYSIDGQEFGYSEKQSGTTKETLGALRTNITKNVDTKFIEARLSLEFENQTRTAHLQNNDELINQDYTHQIKGFTFQHEYVPQLKNENILQSNLYINYGSKPQVLNIHPGVFSSIFHDSIPYQTTIQNINVPQFFTNYSLGYRFAKGEITHAYKAGITYENQELSSQLSIRQNNLSPIQLASDSALNDMRWNRIRYYVEPSMDWAYNKFSVNIRTPLALQTIGYKDSHFELNNRRHDLLLNPSISMRQKTGYESELSFNYNYSNNFGTIADVYRGIILRNYRTLGTNSSGINESNTHSASLSFRAGRAIKLRFYNMDLNFTQSTSNNILSSRINNEIIETNLINIENTFRTYSINTGYDTYIFALASALKLKAGVAMTEYNQLLNDRLLPFRNIVYTAGPNIEFNIWKGFNLSYDGRLSVTQSRQTAELSQLNRTFTQITQNVSLPLNINKNIHANLSANHLFTQQVGSNNLNYLFSNFFIRYRHPKLKTDFELTVDNLTNIKSFDTYSATVNLIANSSYVLRGRFAFLKVVFNL